jgi:BirA family transcriptional regulator, biotin operon repressor / biotin---[acetyl-CoA-carboxylase] ligase
MYSMIGSRIIELESVNSTNNKAREMLGEQKLPHGTVITAKGQFAGRGYGSNKWESATGENITMSVILYPHFLEPSSQFLLTKVISLSLRDAVREITDNRVPFFIKWPNDIYAGHDKIAGILIENSIMGENIRDSICGIGLNVNQEVFISDAPNPVSLKMISQSNHDLEEVLDCILFHLNRWYNELEKENLGLINEAYYSSLYRLGEEAPFTTQGERFRGIITGTDDYGRLVIKTTENGIRCFDFKEVAFVRE